MFSCVACRDVIITNSIMFSLLLGESVMFLISVLCASVYLHHTLAWVITIQIL